jgi:hypothetical protein
MRPKYKLERGKCTVTPYEVRKDSFFTQLVRLFHQEPDRLSPTGIVAFATTQSFLQADGRKKEQYELTPTWALLKSAPAPTAQRSCTRRPLVRRRARRVLPTPCQPRTRPRAPASATRASGCPMMFALRVHSAPSRRRWPMPRQPAAAARWPTAAAPAGRTRRRCSLLG